MKMGLLEQESDYCLISSNSLSLLNMNVSSNFLLFHPSLLPLNFYFSFFFIKPMKSFYRADVFCSQLLTLSSDL